MHSDTSSRYPWTATLVVVFCSTWQTASTHAQAQLHRFLGDSPQDRFGHAVRGAGDVDGDGFADVIVGAPRDDNAGFASGSATVYSGATGAVIHTINGDSIADWFGFAVSGTGDVNGDGFDDFIVGAIGDDNNALNSGSARVYSGADGTVLYTMNGIAENDSFGGAVGGAGDVDGDGLADFVVGASSQSTTGLQSGSVHVYSGASGATLHSFHGSTHGALLGHSVRGAGDVDGDGFDDIIAGAPYDSTSAGPQTGSARVFSGRTGAVLHIFNGAARGDVFGGTVDGAGDLNGDGFADLIVGSPFNDQNGLQSGVVQVYSGIDGSPLYTLRGKRSAAAFGVSVSGAGDVNGDGYSDFVVGQHHSRNHGTSSGSAYLYSGFDGTVLYVYNGESAGDEFGVSVSGAGDINGDGFDDLIVGAHKNAAGGTEAGAAYVLTYVQDGRSAIGTSFCPAAYNSTGARGHLSAIGSDLVASNNLTLQCDSLPSRSFGYFITSTHQGYVAFPGGANGHLCIVGPDIGRFIGSGQIQSTFSGSTVSLAIDLTRFPQPTGLVSVAAGETWNFQYWFRESGPIGPSSNFTDALQIEFR